MQHATLAHLTSTEMPQQWLICNHSDLCGLVENLMVAPVSPSLRPPHLIRRSRFTDEDATKMWSPHPALQRASAPVPTPASPLQRSPLSPRTILRARLAPSVRPSPRSNSPAEALVRSTPDRIKAEELNAGLKRPDVADLDVYRL